MSRPCGVKLLDAGGHFIKVVDPAARGFTKWFAETLLEAQARALADLGEMAPKFFYSEGKLVIENLGKFSGGAIAFLKATGATATKIPVAGVNPNASLRPTSRCTLLAAYGVTGRPAPARVADFHGAA